MSNFVACDSIDVVGTSYQGVNAQWSLQFDVPTEDGEDYELVTATIYNWKVGYIPTDKYEWHVGGFDFNSVDLVQGVLDS